MKPLEKNQLRILFMGTPEFAEPSLKALLEAGYNVVGAVCQPDRPKGRGHKLMPPPVKECAAARGIPVLQFERVSRDGLEAVKELNANLFVTVAFGQILSRELLAMPEHGCINVHGSLLPKYRGSAPIEQAIINGETETGVTTMFTVYELDAGDMLLSEHTSIPPDMTGGELREVLSELGARCLIRTLEALVNGTLEPVPQREEDATYYPMFRKGFDRIDFSKTRKEIHDLTRALCPAGTYALLEGEKYRIFRVSPAEGEAGSAVPGEIVAADASAGLIVAAGDGLLSIEELQRPGGKRMRAADMLRGRKLPVGGRFEPVEDRP